ncbi:MAG: DUF4331 family protein [Acidimicrobiia bacterium]|nr:DUF4331 family protein [Acidimicrobiia bacterium]
MSSFIKKLGVGAVALALVALAAMPGALSAADHLDAPGLTSPGGDSRLDIGDLYAFKDGSYTSMIQTVNPLTAPGLNHGFHPSARYEFMVDQTGNAKPDLRYSVEFGAQRPDGEQWMTLRQLPADGGGSVIAEGWTGTTLEVAGGGWIRADVYDDPFFFDLISFLDNLNFCTVDPAPDTLAGANVSAIVLKVPAATVAGTGDSQVGVWARTVLDEDQVDRIGFPAINTVFIPSGVKNTYNETKPRLDSKKFSQYLAPFDGVLLPDILPLDTASSAGFEVFNGRQLADDVIDIELNIITGGAIPSDCVDANDRAFSATFPYLAPKH